MAIQTGHGSGSTPSEAALAAAQLIRGALDYDIYGPNTMVPTGATWVTAWPLPYGEIEAVILSTRDILTAPLVVSLTANGAPMNSTTWQIPAGQRSAKMTNGIAIAGPEQLANIIATVTSAPPYPGAYGLRIAFVLKNLFLP